MPLTCPALKTVEQAKPPEPENGHTYRAAGLTIAAHCRLHGLGNATAASPDLWVMPGRPHWADQSRHIHYISSHRIDRTPAVIVKRGEPGFAFRYADGTEFWIDVTGQRIWMHVATTIEDASTYLVGIVLSFALRLRGDFSLHASAIQVDDVAIALIGPHAAGKSTLAAALGRRGRPVLTDDILRLTRSNGAWTAHPFGGVIRLWAEGESLVFGAPGRLPPLTPTWPKRGLVMGSHGVEVAADALPLGGLVFLKPTAEHDSPRLRALTTPHTALGLIGNSSASVLLTADQRCAEFHDVASIAQLPSVEIVRPDSGDSLNELVALVEEWVASLPPRAG